MIWQQQVPGTCFSSSQVCLLRVGSAPFLYEVPGEGSELRVTNAACRVSSFGSRAKAR